MAKTKHCVDVADDAFDFRNGMPNMECDSGKPLAQERAVLLTSDIVDENLYRHDAASVSCRSTGRSPGLAGPHIAETTRCRHPGARPYWRSGRGRRSTSIR